MAEKFETLVRSDKRFEIAAERHLALVVFRLKAGDDLTKKLLHKMNSSGKLHCIPTIVKGRYIIRYEN